MDSHCATEDSEKLLVDNESIDDDSHRRRLSLDRAWCRRIIILLALGLVTSNSLWYVSKLQDSCKTSTSIEEAEYYAEGKPSRALVSFQHDWVGLESGEHDGQRYHDNKWGSSMFPDHGGSVSLSRDFRRQHDLPDAAISPEDPDKMIYMIAGYHQLHCLSVVRDAVYFLNGTLNPWPDKGGFLWDHVLHCIDAVRQGLECFLDPTLINLGEEWPGIPNGQMHVCRNKKALDMFATKHGHDIPVDPRTKKGHHSHGAH